MCLQFLLLGFWSSSPLQICEPGGLESPIYQKSLDRSLFEDRMVPCATSYLLGSSFTARLRNAVIAQPGGNQYASRCETDGKESGGEHKLDGRCMHQSTLHLADERHPRRGKNVPPLISLDSRMWALSTWGITYRSVVVVTLHNDEMKLL